MIAEKVAGGARARRAGRWPRFDARRELRSRSRAARARARRRERRDGATRPRARSSTPTRRASRRTACRASPQYATHLRNGRADGDAVPRVVARARRRGARRRRAAGSRFPPARWRSTRRSRARASSASRSPASPTAIISASPRITSSRSAPPGMVGLAMGNSPAAMPAAGGRQPIFGTNPIAAVFPRRDAPPLVDRPVAVGSRARQADGRGEGGQADSARLGARRATAEPTTDPEGRPRQARCCRWAATKGAMLALVVELLVTRADRRGDGLRGRARSSSTKATGRASGRRSSSSIPMRSPAARPTSSASRRWSPR